MSFKSTLAATFRRMFTTTVSVGSEQSDAKLKGTTAQDKLDDGTPTTRVTIEAAELKSGKKYKFENVSLTINGDIPDRTSIKGFNGQLTITGDVGEKAKLTAIEPEYTQHHSEKRTGIIMAGKAPVPYTYTAHWDTDTGAKPPFDKVAGIVVKGKLGKKVKLSASLGVPVKAGP